MFPLFLLSLYHCDYVSCGLRDEGFLRPLSNTPHGWRSPGAQPQSCRTLAPRLRAWGQSLLLALEPASAEGTLPPASQEPAALLRPLTRLLPAFHSRCCSQSPSAVAEAAAACGPEQTPRFQQLVSPGVSYHCRTPLPTLPCAVSAWLFLTPRPLLCHWEQFYWRERARHAGASHTGTGQGCSAPGRWYSFIVQVLTGL